MGKGNQLDIDGGNSPTVGKRVLFFIAGDDGEIQKWPAKILAHYDSLKHAANYVNEPNAAPVNSFCAVPPQGQVVYLLKVETAGSDYRVEAYADSSRQAGTFDEYHEGDLRV
jgi:hypothetical protein